MKTCWLYRTWHLVGADASGGAPLAVQRHWVVCPDCQARAAHETRLAETLRVAAERERVPAPPFLANRIVRTLQPSSPEAVPSAALRPILATAILAAAALLAIQLATRERPDPRPAPNAGAEPVAERLALPTLNTVIPTPERLLEWGGQLDQPLEAELEAVVRDARNAVQFLASNFLLRDEL